MLKTLFSYEGPINRRDYVLIALIGVVIKQCLDLYVASLFKHNWFPLSYLIPLGLPIDQMRAGDRLFMLTMLAVSLPFAWVGIAITVKRWRTIGWPWWLAFLFFVPIANIVSFVIAALWPERPEIAPSTSTPSWMKRFVPRDVFGAALLAMFASAVLAAALVALATKGLSDYGWGLFAAIPFAQGTLAALLFSVHERRTIDQCIAVAVLSTCVTALALIAVALEGAICIAMALPLALCFAVLGAILGYHIQKARPGGSPTFAAFLVACLCAPAVMGAEVTFPNPSPVYMVQSSVVVDAPPNVVWRNVVSFPELPAPSEAIFKLGVAYPERARIVGHGVGAVRYCE